MTLPGTYDLYLERLDEAGKVLGFTSDTFKVMLTTSSYTEDKDAHDFRNDVTNEVTGTGYTAGGNTATVSVTLDTAMPPRITMTRPTRLR